MVRGEPQTFATDWWGVGVMLFELADGGGLPWSAADADDDITMLNRISSHTLGTVRAPRRAVLSGVEHLTDLINLLLDPNRETRLGAGAAAEVMQHPFWGGFNFDKLLESEHPSPLHVYAQSQLMFRMEQVAEWKEFDAAPYAAENDAWFAAYV